MLVKFANQRRSPNKKAPTKKQQLDALKMIFEIDKRAQSATTAEMVWDDKQNKQITKEEWQRLYKKEDK